MGQVDADTPGPPHHHDPWRLPAWAAKYGIDPTPLLDVVADALRPPDAAD